MSPTNTDVPSMSSVHPGDRWNILTRTGPGEPAGELLRRYWQPIGIASEFPAGAPPAHIRVLSENLVLFRDEAGELGLLALLCPHRNADLSYGRIENGGLRCPYHGWLFDRSGACLEQPNVPAAQRSAVNWRQPSFPVQERGGLVWAYLGSGEPPVLPDYPFLDAPAEHVFINRWLSECNYLQANEGNIDPSHTSFVHRMEHPAADATMTGFEADSAPRLSVVETSYGFRLLAERDYVDGKTFLRCSNFILPNGASANGFEAMYGLGGATMLWHVPIDDHTHYRYEITYHAHSELDSAILAQSIEAELDENGKRRRLLENRFLQDRSEMIDKTFAGVGTAFPIHDLLVTESMGSISDRRTEHLTPSDLGVMRARRMLLQAVEDVQAGKEPKGIWREDGLGSFTDFVTFSDWIEKNADPAEHAEQMTRRNIYARTEPDNAG
ncbi:Rieske 2Fe-2S domain-containing protein [Nocardia sienata]|uniref:Rieske 2Fe-2S domain-containing protein n=1 Tax=Nocardia sienata TaxID=248552 RepID=UPI000A00B2F9|nr:Rieske 2Fe-2S domain-containing protein [Nocardia sienata]